MVTSTAQGIPGDAINVGLIGTKEDVVSAFHAAGWYPADPINVLLGRVARMTISTDVTLDCPSSFDRRSCRALPGFGTIHSEAYRAHNSLPLHCSIINSCVADPAVRIIGELEASFGKCSPIKLGTPDPYMPPESLRVTSLGSSLGHAAVVVLGS
jgi:hypothetical protein